MHSDQRHHWSLKPTIRPASMLKRPLAAAGVPGLDLNRKSGVESMPGDMHSNLGMDEVANRIAPVPPLPLLVEECCICIESFGNTSQKHKESLN